MQCRGYILYLIYLYSSNTCVVTLVGVKNEAFSLTSRLRAQLSGLLDEHESLLSNANRPEVN